MSLFNYDQLQTVGNGSIYNSGYVTAQQSAIRQNELIQSTTGGKKSHVNDNAIPLQQGPVTKGGKAKKSRKSRKVRKVRKVRKSKKNRKSRKTKRIRRHHR